MAALYSVHAIESDGIYTRWYRPVLITYLRWFDERVVRFEFMKDK